MKKTMKTRFMAGALALMISGAPIPLVQAEDDQSVTEETQVELIEMFKSEDSDLSEPNFAGDEYEYVNDNGESRYYISYLEEIDGFKRTENKRPVKDLFSVTMNDSPFTGDYYYLYANMNSVLLIPLSSKETVVIIGDDTYLRTNIITTIDPEVIDILLQTGTYRLTDNSFRLIDISVAEQKKIGRIGLGIMKPTELTDEYIKGELDYLNQEDKIYSEEYDGYLVSLDFEEVSKDFLKKTEKDKMITLTRDKKTK